MGAKINIIRLKYELQGDRNREQWRTTIGAYSLEDAEKFLVKVLGSNIIIHEIGTVTKLDAVTDSVAETIAKEVSPPKIIKPEKPKHVCTYCGRDDFKDQTGLKGHMTRWCEVAKAEREAAEKEK